MAPTLLLGSSYPYVSKSFASTLRNYYNGSEVDADGDLRDKPNTNEIKILKGDKHVPGLQGSSYCSPQKHHEKSSRGRGREG